MTDGSGLGYVSSNLNGGGSLGHLFTRKLLGSITGNYSHNKFLMNLDANGQPLTANSITCGALLRMNATQRFQVFGNYFYFRQLSQGFSGYIPSNGNWKYLHRWNKLCFACFLLKPILQCHWITWVFVILGNLRA